MTFNIKTDVKVEVLLPASNAFILGVSKLGGADVLSGAGLSWVDVSANVASIETSNGPTVQSGIYTQTEPGSLAVTYQSAEYDPNFNQRMRAGVGIRVSYFNGTSWQFIFRGKIQTLSTTYNYDGSNKVTVYALDALQELLALNAVGYTAASPKYTGNAIVDIATAAGFSGSFNAYPGVAKMSDITGDLAVGEYINECVKCELGLLWYHYQLDQVLYRDRGYLQSVINTPTYSLSDVHSTATTHICYQDIRIGTDSDQATNDVLGSYTQGSGAYLHRANTDSVQLYGTHSERLDLDLDHTTNAELISWLEAAVARPVNQSVQEIIFKATDPKGDLFAGVEVTVGDAIHVHKSVGSNTIDENFVITRVSHYITVTQWQVTLELWKGL